MLLEGELNINIVKSQSFLQIALILTREKVNYEL